MSFQETLILAGFGIKEASELEKDNHFKERNRHKSVGEIKEKIDSIAKVYNTNIERIRKAIMSFPNFMAYDHQLILNGIKETYRCTYEQAAKAVLKFPIFAGRNHRETLDEITDAYKCTEGQAAKAVLRFPKFAGRKDHKLILKGIRDVYKCTEGQAAKAVLYFPQFAGYNHQRVLDGIKDVYKCTDEQASKAVLRNPIFAGLDHQRVLRRLFRIGRMVNMKMDEVKEETLKNPIIASYSGKRYLATMDIVRHLRTEGLNDNSRLLTLWKKNSIVSPYVPQTKLSITQAKRRDVYTGEPPLMKLFRRNLEAKTKMKI